jgi:protein TonB
MIGQTSADRTRRRTVAGGVLLAHALLVWVAIHMRADQAREQASLPPMIVTTLFELPRAQRPLPPNPSQIRPQLQEFAPQPSSIPIEQQDIVVPEPDVPVLPITMDASPPATVSSSQPDAAFAGDAGNAGGQAGADVLVLLRRVIPAFPKAAARRGERGTTQVILHVTRSGRVDQVKVERSSGSALLDAAAVESFRRWRFQRLPDSAGDGRWLRTAQRFVLYQFLYSRLDADALEIVYAENLKPKPGAGEEVTPGSQEALLQFIAQLEGQAFDARGGASARDLAELRGNLAKWGPTKSAVFRGIVGSSRWSRHGIKSRVADGSAGTVEVSWNMFEVRHEKAISEWLIAMDRDGQIWAARAGQSSWTKADNG